MNRVLKAFAIAFAVVVALVSCKKEDQAKEVALTGIELNATTQALQVGQDFQLKVTYKPENATNKPEVTWASDAPAVATVDAGKVVAVAAGTAKITAKAGAFSATCTVTVTSAEEEIVPVEGNSAWSVIGAFLDSDWKKDYVCAEKDGAFVLKNVKLAKDNKVKFRKDKDWAVNRGINKENEAAELAADTPTKAIQGGGDIIIPSDGIYDLYYFAEKEAIVYVAKDAALPEIPDFTEETPEGLEIDGSADDWAKLDAANVVSLVLPEGAEKTWLKSAKAYYDDKLYLLLEISDEAIASNKVRMHVYLDADATGKFKQNGWAKSSIDYATEGKIVDGGFCAYSSKLYSTPEEGWKTVDTGFSPKCEGAGQGNLYELSMDFTGATAELPVAFNIGLDVADTDYNISGFLPVADKMARIVKVGATDPGEGGEEPVTLTDLSTINALAANTEFELNAIVAESFKISDTNSAAIVTDGVNCFYLFFNPATNNTYVKGDFVNAKGKISIYNHLIESVKNPTVTVLEQGVTVPELLPIEIASFDTFVMSDHPAGLYTATGKYVVDGSYTNLKIDGDTKDASLSGNIDANWDSKTVKVTGWFTGTSNNASHTYIRVVDIQEVGGSAGSEPTDLSALQANCYVISNAGAYKFPALKGNSNESVGTVASAAIIWETYNSGAAVTANSVIAKVGVNDGFIVFETPATLTPGNALIAALDASENILWSWHIWIPKNAITSSQFGLGGQTLMDRNLGALEVAVAGAITPESQGMLYSWGRKDPFLGNAVIGEKASYAVAEGQASVTIGASGVLMTVAESIKNPTTFVQTGSDDNKDWCSESDVAATLWGETKTMYDPCPAGYQVPYNPWDDAKNGIWNLKADDAILTTLGFSKNADQHWFQMGDPATVFPICGYLDQDGYKNRGARAYYWSARSTGTGIANVIRVDSSNNKVTDERKSRAGNIRCVVSE